MKSRCLPFKCRGWSTHKRCVEDMGQSDDSVVNNDVVAPFTAVAIIQIAKNQCWKLFLVHSTPRKNRLVIEAA